MDAKSFFHTVASISLLVVVSCSIALTWSYCESRPKVVEEIKKAEKWVCVGESDWGIAAKVFIEEGKMAVTSDSGKTYILGMTRTLNEGTRIKIQTWDKKDGTNGRALFAEGWANPVMLINE